MQISNEDFLMFIDRALDGMMKIVEELGDERANLNPDLPGANSPYAILFHCVAVANYWIGTLLAGRTVERDRNSEFKATGSVEPLGKSVRELQAQLRKDIDHVRGEEQVAVAPNSEYNPLRGTEYDSWTQGAALVHAYEELAQHLGQMELTRDILVKQTS